MDKKGRNKFELFIILGISILLSICIVSIANADLIYTLISQWDRGLVRYEGIPIPYGWGAIAVLTAANSIVLGAGGLELGFNQTADISIANNTFWILGFNTTEPYDPNILAQVNYSLINDQLGITNDFQFAFGNSSYYVSDTDRFPVDMLNKTTYIHFNGTACFFDIYATANDSVKTKSSLLASGDKVLVADETGCLDATWCSNWQYIPSNVTFQTRSFNNSNPSNDLAAVGLFDAKTEESCNGVDDDCDTFVDEGELCGPGQVCNNGFCQGLESIPEFSTVGLFLALAIAAIGIMRITRRR